MNQNTPEERAKARKTALDLIAAARRDVEGDGGPTYKAVCHIAQALVLLTEQCEAQDEMIADISRRTSDIPTGGY